MEEHILIERVSMMKPFQELLESSVEDNGTYECLQKKFVSHSFTSSVCECGISAQFFFNDDKSKVNIKIMTEDFHIPVMIKGDLESQFFVQDSMGMSVLDSDGLKAITYNGREYEGWAFDSRLMPMPRKFGFSCLTCGTHLYQGMNPKTSLLDLGEAIESYKAHFETCFIRRDLFKKYISEYGECPLYV